MMPTHDALLLMFMMIHMMLSLYYEMSCAKVKLQRATSNEALKVNTSVKELWLVSVFLLFLLVFWFVRVLLLRGVRAADVCGAAGQRYRR